MIKEADQLVETIISPVAEQHGYFPVERRMGDDWWQFQRKSLKNPSFIISIIPPNRIQLSLRIQSFREPMPEIDPAWWYHNTGNLLPEICTFKSKAGFEKTLQFFAFALQEKGFALLDQIEQMEEPQDILHPTKRVNLILYQNHQKYQQEFFKHHAVDESNYMQVLNVLQNELDNWKESDEDAEEKLLRIIAVYCGLYERLQATWHWHEEFEMVELLIPRKRNGVSRYRPISQIYGMMREGGSRALLPEYEAELRVLD